MVRITELDVRAVLFLNGLNDSGHSYVGPAAVVFLVKSSFFSVQSTLVLLLDNDEVPRPRPRKRPERFFLSLWPLLGIFPLSACACS